MARKSKQQTPIKEQDPLIRQTNFQEVCLGYTLEEGILEADRCLQCKNAPCIKECPVNIDIPGFILAVREGDLNLARSILAEYTNLPAICGRVCPQEKQCEQVCKLGKAKGFEPVAIGKLERFVADHVRPRVSQLVPSQQKEKVAIVGSGPSGLTAAGDLAKLGYDVTIFEALHSPGGVLTYGIPEFRLPKDIVQREIKQIEDLGVTIETNVIVGKTLSMSEIKEQFAACYLAVGAGTPYFLGIPGTTLSGVYSSSEYLTRINLMRGYEFPRFDTPVKRAKKVAVIGGGNVAMDAARSAKRLGASEVTIVYRRSLEELPARIEEYHHSVAEGVSYRWLTNPMAYLGDESGNLTGMTCIQMELGEPDASGRRRPVEIAGSELTLEVDVVIEAIGQGANQVLLDHFKELPLNERGYIKTSESSAKTEIEGIFAGGDIVTGAATVILAMEAGKKAACEIDTYIKQKAENKG